MDIDRFHFTLGGLPLQDDPFADSNNSHQALSSASDSFYSPTASPTTPRTYSAASASALDFSSPTQGSLNSNNNSFASAFASGSFGMTPPQTAASAYFPPQGIYPAPVQPALADVHFNHGLATPSAPITPARRLTPHGAFDFGEIMPMNMACHSSPLRDLTAEGLNTRGHVDTQFWHRTLAPATSPASVAPFDLLLRMASPSSSFSSGDFPFLDPTSSGSHHAMASPVSLVVNSPGSLYYSYTPPTNQSTLRSLASPRRRVATNSAQRKSTPLQAVAALGPKKDRRAIRKSQMVNGVEVPVEETPRHACNLSGCNKAYARPEHLIRHIKSYVQYIPPSPVFQFFICPLVSTSSDTYRAVITPETRSYANFAAGRSTASIITTTTLHSMASPAMKAPVSEWRTNLRRWYGSLRSSWVRKAVVARNC